MSKFIAVPVGQGDAFYLDRGNWSVLVDGGRARSSFGSIFYTATGVTSVNVLVCTHNDADHANGILGFLQSGLQCNEVWVPGRWLDALPGVLRPFSDVVVDLVDEVAQEVGEIVERPSSEGTTPLELLAEHYTDRPQIRGIDDGQPLGEDGWPQSLRDDLEQAVSWDSEGWPWFERLERFPYYLPFRTLKMTPAHIRLFWSAIEAASKIRAIASEAFHRGIPVRWFEYDVNRPSGGRIGLEPLNARAIARFRPSGEPILRLLALSVANRESLVFWSRSNGDVPGVLFSADSDLKNIRLPVCMDGAIATVPHHGSEANANAYSAIASACNAKSLTWVRSDGRYRSRPGSSFLGVAGRRLCTICRLPGQQSSTKQPVHLFVSRGAWTRHRTTQICTCT